MRTAGGGARKSAPFVLQKEEGKGVKLIFRKVNENNPEDIRQFDELMDDISERADDDEVLIRRIRETNAREDQLLMVAEDEETGRICGSLIGVVFNDFCGQCAPIMVVENVVTHHDYRRKGVARALLSEIEAWGREKGVRYAMLCSGMNRTEAHCMYERAGYEAVKGFKKYLS